MILISHIFQDWIYIRETVRIYIYEDTAGNDRGTKKISLGKYHYGNNQVNLWTFKEYKVLVHVIHSYNDPQVMIQAMQIRPIPTIYNELWQ